MSAARSRTGEVALVTGGAVRIGRAIVERLAADGFAVAIHCHRSREAAEALALAVEARGGRAAVVAGDLTDPAALVPILARAHERLGAVTHLVNNASIFEPSEIGSLEETGFDRHLAINLRAPVFLAKAMAAALPAGREGAIVNIIDQQVLRPTPLFFSYTLSKAALFTATVTLAQALAPRIRVNAVAPGPTLKAARQSDASFAAQRAAVPLGRGSAPEDVADAVAWLMRARSVTGEMIAVDGGQHIAWRTPDVIELDE